MTLKTVVLLFLMLLCVYSLTTQDVLGSAVGSLVMVGLAAWGNQHRANKL
jgi:hypothetical protein